MSEYFIFLKYLPLILSGEIDKVTVTNAWGVYTNDWGVYNISKMDDINIPCSVEHRGERGRIRNEITGELNLYNNLEGFSFDYLTYLF